jgi:beta-glucosidase/6-phospho-beta-glucosidase/beta-galactosidase
MYRDRYNSPSIYITENGCDAPNEDSLPLAQALNDTFRVDYFKGNTFIRSSIHSHAITSSVFLLSS